MTSHSSNEDLKLDCIIMIGLDEEEREKTHLIHEWIAEERGVTIDDVELTEVVRMIYNMGMLEFDVETKREREWRLKLEEQRRKMEEFDRMCDKRVKFNDDRFLDALMRKEGEE